MATFLTRLVERSGGTLPAASRDHFGDDGASAHQDAINRLAEAGIVGGTGAGAYSPSAAVTRAQMAAFLVRAYDHRAKQDGQPALADGENAFADDDGSPLAPEIDKAASAGLAGGFSDGTYRPGGRVPRDQMATFLARVLDLAVERGMATVPAGPRALTSTGFRPYATVGPVALHAPADLVEVIGFHQAGHDGAQAQQSSAGSPRSLVLPSRSRGTDLRSAADVVADPSREIRSPVTGRVLRAGSYTLYCRHTDQYAVIEPDARPGWEVKVLHVQGLRLSVGQRVEAGTTVLASGPRLLPFRSQVDDHTAAPHWPHVHVEVVDPSIPDRPGSGGGC
jgi:murein DD-endopeptidase MepM/ murein hydrolase activator NlpD